MLVTEARGKEKEKRSDVAEDGSRCGTGRRIWNLPGGGGRREEKGKGESGGGFFEFS